MYEHESPSFCFGLYLTPPPSPPSICIPVFKVETLQVGRQPCGGDQDNGYLFQVFEAGYVPHILYNFSLLYDWY